MFSEQHTNTPIAISFFQKDEEIQRIHRVVIKAKYIFNDNEEI